MSLVAPDTLITALELSVRASNALLYRAAERPGGRAIRTFGELTAETEDSLLAIRSFGQWSLREVKTALGAHGLHLGMAAEDWHRLTGRPETQHTQPNPTQPGSPPFESMTLRDYFAAMALRGLVPLVIEKVEVPQPFAAVEAYRFADAMLWARARPVVNDCPAAAEICKRGLPQGGTDGPGD
jgi:hypothetical protein